MDTKLHQILKARRALSDMKLAYDRLLEIWHQSDIDLNDLDANNLYPFDKSFDEIEVSQWVTTAIEELEVKLSQEIADQYVTVEVEGCYAGREDITVIMEHTMVNGEALSSEAIGWYYGSPNDECNESYGDRDMLAIYK